MSVAEYAGVTTKRLSELRGHDLSRRRASTIELYSGSSRSSMSDILAPSALALELKEAGISFGLTRKGGHAGILSERYNERAHSTRLKTLPSPLSNYSGRMACILNYSIPSVSAKGGDSLTAFPRKSLRQYFGSDDLGAAFCTKFELTDRKSGRTEIMAARRPGKAAAEVNISNFDSYKVRQERESSKQKFSDTIEQTVMGFTPRYGNEIHRPSCFSLTPLSASMRERHIDSCNNWLSAAETAKQEPVMGHEKRKYNVPWSQNTILLTQRVVEHDDDRNRLLAFGSLDAQSHPIKAIADDFKSPPEDPVRSCKLAGVASVGPSSTVSDSQ